MDVLIDSQYFYGVDAFKNLYKASYIKIEVYENFRKMSFRNRCRIAGSNGRIDLNIPIEGGRDQRSPMKDLKISYREDWQRKHWGAIFSAYGRSPWFEHYHEELKNLYEKRVGYLVDWNTQTFEWATKKLGRFPGISFTENYRKNYSSEEEKKVCVQEKLIGFYQISWSENHIWTELITIKVEDERGKQFRTLSTTC